MVNNYKIYEVTYQALAAVQKAVVATTHKNDIPVLLEIHLRHNPDLDDAFRTAKDIGFKVQQVNYTGLTTDKEAVLSPFYESLGKKGCLSVDTAPHCDFCGSITVRNGRSYKCLNCGASG